MRFLDTDNVPPRTLASLAYPWQRVADIGLPASLEYGQDWDDTASAEQVINSARAWGYRRGYRVRTRRLSSQKVVIQFIRPGGSELV